MGELRGSGWRGGGQGLLVQYDRPRLEARVREVRRLWPGLANLQLGFLGAISWSLNREAGGIGAPESPSSYPFSSLRWTPYLVLMRQLHWLFRRRIADYGYSDRNSS